MTESSAEVLGSSENLLCRQALKMPAITVHLVHPMPFAPSDAWCYPQLQLAKKYSRPVALKSSTKLSSLAGERSAYVQEWWQSRQELHGLFDAKDDSGSIAVCGEVGPYV